MGLLACDSCQWPRATANSEPVNREWRPERLAQRLLCDDGWLHKTAHAGIVPFDGQLRRASGINCTNCATAENPLCQAHVDSLILQALTESGTDCFTSVSVEHQLPTASTTSQPTTMADNEPGKGQEPTSEEVGILPAAHWATHETPDVGDGDSALGEDAASSTASLATSILKYRTINGRTYHSERGNAQYW